MTALRLLGWFLLSLALMALGADLVHSAQIGEIHFRTTAEALTAFGLDTPPAPEDGFALDRAARNTALVILLGVPGLILTLFFRPLR